MQLVIGEYSFCYLCFNKGWNLIFTQNSNPSKELSRWSSLVRVQLKVWQTCFPNKCTWPHWKTVDTAQAYS